MDVYNLSVWVWIGIALVIMPIIFFKTAPYGRHTPAHTRFTIQSRFGWLIMEAPSALVIALMLLLHPPQAAAPWLLLGLWELHYVHRAFIYPFRMRAGDKPMPLGIVAGAFFFTSVNGFLNGYQLTHADYGGWAGDPRFALGAVLFLLGFAVNQHADHVLLTLRGPGERGYKIPHGGLYRFVSCPNYLGELLTWTGWAVASWSLAGVSFALWTLANLLPRAVSHHRWYQTTFADYPKDRRALIPFLL